MESQDTPIHNNTILEAISGLRLEMNQRFNNLEARLRFVEDKVTNIEERVINIEERVTSIEKRVTNIEGEFFSFSVRLKRVEAGVLEALSIGKNLEADVMIIKAEVELWSHDITDLQKKVA